MGTGALGGSPSFGGEASLIDASGKVRTGWGVVDAPPEPPIEAFGQEKLPTFGDVNQPTVENGNKTSIGLDPNESTALTAIAELPASVQDLVLQAEAKGQDIEAGGSGAAIQPGNGKGKGGGIGLGAIDPKELATKPDGAKLVGVTIATDAGIHIGEKTPTTLRYSDGSTVTLPTPSSTQEKQAFLSQLPPGSQVNQIDPLKISLVAGKDATVNSTDHELLDVNGKTVKTSGGLNANEAWLVNDPQGTGVMHDGVMDFSKLIGNQDGAANGFDRLRQLYPDAVKTDADGRQYIDTAIASRDGLRLATSSGQEISADKVVSKIYLDDSATSQSSADGQTTVRQQGEVVYHDGATAKAADEWFTGT